MRRRSLLSMLAVSGAAPAVPMMAQFPASGGQLKITAVELFRVEGEFETTWLEPSQYQARAIDVYDEFRPDPIAGDTELKSGVRRQSQMYLRIGTDGGVEGLYGPIDAELSLVINQQLRPFLMGKDPLAGEALWDQMYRLNRHARRGHFMMGISAVDNTLWDLRGKYFNMPVYRLLGGPTRARVRAYGSALGHGVEPGPLRKWSLEFKEQGFIQQKWFLPYGPGSGSEGLAKNVAMVRNLREALGDDVDIMFDAYSGWDINYAVMWAKQVEQYRPRWIEEAFAADKIESFAELSRLTSIPVASGEHFYNRWETHDYLRAGAVSIVQADPEWCGGISELVKICALASVYDARVAPHGHSLHAALHVVASQSPMTCPFVEYLINKMRTYYAFEKNELRPVNGEFELPERAGFGIELDEAKIDRRTVVEG